MRVIDWGRAGDTGEAREADQELPLPVHAAAHLCIDPRGWGPIMPTVFAVWGWRRRDVGHGGQASQACLLWEGQASSVAAGSMSVTGLWLEQVVLHMLQDFHPHTCPVVVGQRR